MTNVDNNIIKKNICQQNTQNGIALLGSSSANTITENICDANDTGIDVPSSGSNNITSFNSTGNNGKNGISVSGLMNTDKVFYNNAAGNVTFNYVGVPAATIQLPGVSPQVSGVNIRNVAP